MKSSQQDWILFDLSPRWNGIVLFIFGLVFLSPLLFRKLLFLEWWHMAFFVILSFLFFEEGIPLIFNRAKVIVNFKDKNITNIAGAHVQTISFNDLVSVDVEEEKKSRFGGVIGEYDTYRIVAQMKNKKKLALIGSDRHSFIHFFRLSPIARLVNNCLKCPHDNLELTIIEKNLLKRRKLAHLLVALYVILFAFAMLFSYPKNIPTDILFTGLQ
ncbi:hypothetical protein HZA41_00850 [Candidatus Peregrinibacteria bacterium]|nr:hypothetical protein [Candidatus Peregrinibacteria bacterium]